MLLDSLGTLLALEPPAPRLVHELGRRGIAVSPETAEVAFRTEIQHYIGHHLEGSDRAGLERLRDDCARVLREALGLAAGDQETVRSSMLAAIRFRPYPDVVPALRRLRAAGLRLVVVSNWDCSLGDVLDHAGLRTLVDGVVTSAEVGAAKPDARVFRAALEAARCPAERAVYVGDSPANDVAGASAAGIRALLLRRGSERPDEVASDVAPGARAAAEITTLAELPAVL